VIGIGTRLLFDFLLLPYLLIWSYRNEPDVIYSPSHLTHPVAKTLSRLYSIPTVNFVAYSPVLRSNEISQFDPRRILEELNFRFFMGDVVFSRTPTVRRHVRDRSDYTVREAPGVLSEDEIDTANAFRYGEQLRKRFDLPDSTTILCWVGRFVPIKQPNRAVSIASELSDDYHVVFVGDGPMLDDVQGNVPEAVKNRVHFTGMLPHEETLKVIASADGLLLTSETEAYPTVVFEALALGTPVYATPVGVLTELSEDQLHVAESEDLVGLVRNADTASGNMNPHVLQRYSVSRFEDDLIGVFDKLSSSDSQHRGSQQT
jgi:glycosyltransferase involved in cell wall biosynthesis